MRHSRSLWIARSCAVLVSALVFTPAPLHAGATNPLDDYLASRSSANHVVAPAALMNALANLHSLRVPGYSRQTGLACSMCHYGFPQLTPFGRQFKLNGYALTAQQTIGQPGEKAGKETLKLSPFAPLAAMVVISNTTTSKTVAGTQNNTAQFPQEFSAFFAGQITPNAGAFIQLTYAAADAALAIDNVDLRAATHRTIANQDVLLGVTLHNNPTVQDVWNTVPAWGFPFMGSEAAPSPGASPLLEGHLGQQVVGVGAYSLIGNTLYTELTAYRSAPQGGAVPLDASSANTVRAIMPYWRVALQHETESDYMMLGTFGTSAKLYPAGVTGPTDQYVDVAVDAQLEHKVGTGVVIGRATFMHEAQTLDATFGGGGSENLKNTLSTMRASVGYMPNLHWNTNVGLFQTSGSSDNLLFAPGAVSGSRTGSPNSTGLLGELDFNAWQNLRLGAQYTSYLKFNGASTDYDVVAGRKAADNNTLYLFTWFAF